MAWVWGLICPTFLVFIMIKYRFGTVKPIHGDSENNSSQVSGANNPDQIQVKNPFMNN